MRGELQKKLAVLLKQQRGEQTFTSFARKLGIAQSALHRLENCNQNPTLGVFEQILDRLKISYADFLNTQPSSPSIKEVTKSKVPPSSSSVKYPKKKRKRSG